MIHAFKGRKPEIEKALFIAWNAEIAGQVFLDEQTSIWFAAVLRADLASISVARGCNIQDGALLHVDTDLPTRLGQYVTVGHGAIIHGCSIGDNCIIGMGAIILNRAEIRSNCVVGAGALVTEEKSFPEGSLIVGSPARAVRKLTESELHGIRKSAEHYIEIAETSRESYRIK
ncbi:Protein YrdA [subsurface metagenome]